MHLRIATWNINSVRLRIDQVRRFVDAYEPDILCLQETKCRDEHFPTRAFKELGMPHLAIRGQSGYHGVAISSRLPLEDIGTRDFCGIEQARHIQASISVNGASLTIHNVYAPAGGDEPDPEINEKFAHKLAFYREMRDWFSNGLTAASPAQLLVGDLNIAPLETDVWSHRQLLNVVSHTPVEVDHFEAARAAGHWVDVVREHVPADEKLFTWWSYRARDWRASNRGRRLDHIWAQRALAEASIRATVIDEARDWPRPSDHAPVIADFKLF